MRVTVVSKQTCSQLEDRMVGSNSAERVATERQEFLGGKKEEVSMGRLNRSKVGEGKRWPYKETSSSSTDSAGVGDRSVSSGPATGETIVVLFVEKRTGIKTLHSVSKEAADKRGSTGRRESGEQSAGQAWETWAQHRWRT